MIHSEPVTDGTEASLQAENSTFMGAEPEPSKPANKNNELMVRLVAGLIMAPLGIWVVLMGGFWLAAATEVCAVFAALEWSRMVSMKADKKAGLVFPASLVLLAGISILIAHYGFGYLAIYSLIGALLISIAAILMKRSAISYGFGALYVSFPFGAFVLIRNEWTEGGVFLILVMGLVWTTDIAAFLAGKGFGGPRFSPNNSPNKTWTGVLGAMFCTIVAGLALSRFTDHSLIHFGVFAGVISIVAQFGDLMESWWKRQFGVKDTSGVIPGHGGVLDRLDSLMATVSVLTVCDALIPALRLS